MLKEKLINSYKNDKTIYKIALYSDESDESLGRQLHPDFKFSFKSLLGEIYTLGNGMRYINSEELDIKYISKPLSNSIYKKIAKGKFKDVPNYWSITEMLLVDRIMADRDLVLSIYETLDVDKFTFIPYIKLKRGIIPTEVINDKLRRYGYIVNYTINDILKIFDKFIKNKNIEDYKNIDKKHFKEFKIIFKTYVFNKIEKDSKTDMITENMVEISNEDLRNTYIGK